MTSRFSRLSVLACITALAGGLLVASPAAQAASGGVSVSITKVAQFGGTDRRTAVPVKCASTVTCTGVVRWYSGTTLISTPLYYSIPKGATAFVWPKLNSIVASGNYRLNFAEIAPVGRSTDKTIRIEPRAYSAPVGGTITGPTAGISDLKVTRWYFKYGVLSKLDSKNIAFDGDTPYSFNAPLGTNNAPNFDYRFSISAKVNGETRHWYWRGSPSSGTTYAATFAQHHASPVKTVSNKYNFDFGTVTGSVSNAPANTKVRVVGAPAVMPTTQTGKKDLDEPYCGDVYGTTTVSGGTYSVPFIPKSTSSDPRYAVGIIPPEGSAVVQAWRGAGTYGSCLGARKYSFTNFSGLFSAQTLAVGATSLNAGKSVSGVVTFQGFGVRFTDRKLDIRPYVPQGGILALPIIKQAGVPASNTYTVDKLPPGKYWISAGRQESCSLWYPSYYSNNLTYLSSEADRETERWKSFRKISDMSAQQQEQAIAHGATYFTHNSVKGGYAGWMYRDVCVTEGAGAYKLYDTENPALNGNLLDKRGATISGKVDRDGSKTNKEMMVTAVSTGGILVSRSAYTSSSGSFTIRGLESGNYRIIVNTDSWRGIGRNHGGTQYKRVTRGGNYSVGTLRAHF